MKSLRPICLTICLCLFAIPQMAQSQTGSVSKQVEARIGHGLNPATKPGGFALPEGVVLEDGLSEDEAVAIALWNNPSFQAELAALGLARADVIEAGQLRNPSLTLIFPFSVRVLEAVALWPFDALWQRPHRIAAAKLELNRTEETLAAMALDLVRDVRLAYADSLLAESRARISGDAARERREIAVIVNAQFRAGEISELETNASRLDASLTEEQAARFRNDLIVAKVRLTSLLGFASDAATFTLAPNQPVPSPTIVLAANAYTPVSDPVAELIKQALDARPELKAAELAIEAAGQRAKWERSRILAVSAIAKEYGKGANGFEQGPGLQIDLPIFHRNKGAISRAEADIERAAKQLAALRHRDVLGFFLRVHRLHLRLQRSRGRAQRLLRLFARRVDLVAGRDRLIACQVGDGDGVYQLDLLGLHLTTSKLGLVKRVAAQPEQRQQHGQARRQQHEVAGLGAALGAQRGGDELLLRRRQIGAPVRPQKNRLQDDAGEEVALALIVLLPRRKRRRDRPHRLALIQPRVIERPLEDGVADLQRPLPHPGRPRVSEQALRRVVRLDRHFLSEQQPPVEPPGADARRVAA